MLKRSRADSTRLLHHAAGFQRHESSFANPPLAFQLRDGPMKVCLITNGEEFRTTFARRHIDPPLFNTLARGWR
jgi:hypothetical protein